MILHQTELNIRLTFFLFSGVFVTKGDIGTGTILGSAVFNVLFVIGVCALFSGHVSFDDKLTRIPGYISQNFFLSLGSQVILVADCSRSNVIPCCVDSISAGDYG